MLEKLKIAKEQLNFKTIKEDIANFVVDDLEQAGFEAYLDKSHHKWKILPKKELSQAEQAKFDRIKDEQTNFWVLTKKNELTELRKGLIGR